LAAEATMEAVARRNQRQPWWIGCAAAHWQRWQWREEVLSRWWCCHHQGSSARRRARGTLAEKRSGELGGERRAPPWPSTRWCRRGVVSELLPASSSWLPRPQRNPHRSGRPGRRSVATRADRDARGWRGHADASPPSARRWRSCPGAATELLPGRGVGSPARPLRRALMLRGPPPHLLPFPAPGSYRRKPLLLGCGRGGAGVGVVGSKG
jgi:hypothetical protein